MMVVTILEGGDLPIGRQVWHAEGDGGGGDEGDVKEGEHRQQLAESHLKGGEGFWWWLMVVNM